MLRDLLTSAFALAVVLGSSAARADDLYLGGPFNTFNFYIDNVKTTVGAGSVQNSTLDGNGLAFIYCVDLFNDINVSGDYNETAIDTTGYVNGSLVHNAGEIAWLLDQYAVAAEDDTTAQMALQAAIWHVEYGAAYYLDPLSAADSLYNSDLASLGANTYAISNYDWITPMGAGDSGPLQGQVAPLSAVPEPMSIFLLGTVLLCTVSLLKRRLAPQRQNQRV